VAVVPGNWVEANVKVTLCPCESITVSAFAAAFKANIITTAALVNSILRIIPIPP
jgi:hypothetical protein